MSANVRDFLYVAVEIHFKLTVAQPTVYVVVDNNILTTTTY
jgi:hypothetical protein